MKKNYITILGLFFVMVFQSCAIRGIMLDEKRADTATYDSTKVANSFFIAGNTYKNDPAFTSGFNKIVLGSPSKEKRLLFIGNNINGKDSLSVTADLDAKIQQIKLLNAKTNIIPGHFEWRYDKLNGLEFMEDYLEKKLQSETDFLTPNNGCPLESIEIVETIQLLVIDSQWYLENWDTHPKFNDKCQIKTREKLLAEVRGEVKKNANKIILVAITHPIFTNGFHAGRFSFRDHIFPLQGNIPLPGVATLLAQIRSQGGTSVQDRFNKRYNELASELKDIFNEPDHRILLISGLEQNLQYIEQDPFKQIVSGGGSETKPVGISDNGIFSYGGNGFATVDVLEDGSVWTSFYATSATKDAEVLFKHKVFDAVKKPDLDSIPSKFPAYVEASVYDEEAVKKTDYFQSFWGQHYRQVYGTKVKARTAILDTLYGGLEVVRPGGGNQTKSLRVVTKDGKEYNMRALKKSAVQFLENTAFKGVNGEKYFTNTVPEELILDFYTAAHPYAAFAIPEIAKAAEVFYTTPELYYVPKQELLGNYNEEYGNQLFMIVERPTEDFKNRKSFGYPDDVESTDDLLETLRDDEEYTVNEEAYIRARIFDMLIGDWDRHSDQWRWAEFENENGKKEFVPIPRDRDQVFANFDGSFLNALRKIMGAANQFGVYGDDIKDVKWFNAAGSKLDRALIKRSDKTVWMEQATFLQNAITEETVDKAFKNIPPEVQDTTISVIKNHLIARKANLKSIVERYYTEFMKFQMITGTDKDDYFDIIRAADGTTKITAYRIKEGEKGAQLFERTFNSEETEEIWLYGLDDDDTFKVTGIAKKAILIRIIGGQNKDTYAIEEGRRIKIYDRRSKNNDIVSKGGAHFRFTNFYEANLYNYIKTPKEKSSFAISLVNNPDVGNAIGLSFLKDKNDFITNPFGKRTAVTINYQTITQGLAIDFEKGFAAIYGDINLVLGGSYTSKNYTENFFGYGNDTENFDEELSLDFNRVNLSYINGSIGLERDSDYGSLFELKFEIESVEIFRNGDNFFNQQLTKESGVRRYFAKPNFTYTYENFDNKLIPTKGMSFIANIGGMDAFNSEDLTGFLKSSVTFYNSLLSNKRLVLKTNASTHLLVGDNPMFYQSPQLGAATGLRGYRNERFTGQQSFLGNADISYRFQQMKTFLFPVTFIVYGGYDIGRVWVENDTSTNWYSSYGGGLYVRWTDAIKANVSTFYGDEGVRLQFGLGFTY
ncbi:phosphoesterase [Rasiella sp. SM2506]|uniref:phosphoesterase n=1 Tax=Rasiella sp. SM2506 TaxID=3423914 RepID=UPI003D792455